APTDVLDLFTDELARRGRRALALREILLRPFHRALVRHAGNLCPARPPAMGFSRCPRRRGPGASAPSTSRRRAGISPAAPPGGQRGRERLGTGGRPARAWSAGVR